jgi:hypothetical protein
MKSDTAWFVVGGPWAFLSGARPINWKGWVSGITLSVIAAVGIFGGAYLKLRAPSNDLSLPLIAIGVVAYGLFSLALWMKGRPYRRQTLPRSVR